VLLKNEFAKLMPVLHHLLSINADLFDVCCFYCNCSIYLPVTRMNTV